MKTKTVMKKKKQPGKRSIGASAKGKDLSEMTVDDFLQGSFDYSEESDSESGSIFYKKLQKKSDGGVENDNESPNKGSMSNDAINGSDDSNDEDEDEKGSINDVGDELSDDGDAEEKSKGVNNVNDWTSSNFSHKKAVAKLQKTDPEFYKFLQQNDKDLLNFDESDESEAESETERGGKLHKPPDDLQGDSDESDFEGERVPKDSGTITLKMIADWDAKLQATGSKSCETIKEVVHAFHAVLIRVSNEDDASASYVVTGSAVFNAVIQMCVLELQPALKRYLKIPKGTHADPSKNKLQWNKVKNSVKFYLSNLIKLLNCVTSSQIIAVLLKHLHQMTPFAGCFVVLHRPLLKILVKFWSTGEETIRVLSFLCILRLLTHQQDKILERALKVMHLSFIRNCKFVSPSTLPGINFMRRSLVEIYALDVNVAYRHVFLYIRQLAIHLRNAITLPKKESIQAVYNWQFINSLHLWADLLGATVNKPQLQSLLYPLIQVILGTIKLTPTAQYFPVRFHCLQILVHLSKRTSTYIPVLPFILEVLTIFDFNKRHKKLSMKPVDFTFIIRLSKVQLQENGFKDTTIDKVYQLLLEYLTNESNSVSFPDLIIPAIIQLKKFLKKCKIGNYCKKMKQLLDKIEENAGVVGKERQKVSFHLNDQKAIAAWETRLQLRGTPLSVYYESWNRVHQQQLVKKMINSDELGEYNFPVIKKRPKEDRGKSDEPVELFPSDSENDSDISDLRGDERPRKRGKRGSGRSNTSNIKKSVYTNSSESAVIPLEDDQADIIQDLRWEDFN